MLKYILKRVAYSLATLLAIITLTFFLMKALPEGPFNNPKMKPEVKAALMTKYGLNKPLGEQYWIYMTNVFKGDFGSSIKFEGRNVTDIIKNNFPNSLALGWRAMLYASIFGILFGIIAALKHQKVADYLVIAIAIIGVSVPSIIMGPVLAYYLGVRLMWFPVTVDKSQWSLILPSFVLGLSSLAFIARMMRTSMLDVMSQDYIMTAKAKGLSSVQVIVRHMIRNAIMPVVTVLGPMFASIITGSIVIESVFAVGGLGQYFVNSIMQQDYPMIMGVTIFYAILIIASLLIVDVAYAFIDPRLKLSGKKGD